MSILRTLVLVAGLLPTLVSAEVYRCEREGRTVYTDVPCAAGARPQVPSAPAAVVTGAGVPAEVAKQYDERMAREKKARDEADAQWLEAHESRKAEEARIRAALIEGRVIAGMTPAQVRQVLGGPDEISHEVAGGRNIERWEYRGKGRKRSVSFEDGRVTGASDRASKSKTHKNRKKTE